jgi:hypothetical protein
MTLWAFAIRLSRYDFPNRHYEEQGDETTRVAPLMGIASPRSQ